MTENLIIISIIGLVVGFIISIPIAGPTSIVITANALQGKNRYCYNLAIGASFADFVYAFLAVYGLTRLSNFYVPFVPYLLIAGSILVIYIGIKISKTKLDFEEFATTKNVTYNTINENNNGFLTGILIGFFNPSLIIGWIASSLFVFTMLTSLGFNTGGLDKKVTQHIHEINLNNNSIDTTISQIKNNIVLENHKLPELNINDSIEFSNSYPLLLSIFYAFFVSIGSIIWFYYMTLFISKFRMRIDQNIIHQIIFLLGVVLSALGVFLGYKGIIMLG